MKRCLPIVLALVVLCLAAAPAAGPVGYYWYPALHGDTLVFTAEGDLWSVGISGGVARRLTSHPGEETSAAISPDGSTVAFSAAYEGPQEVYTMPLAGGIPVRQTWDGGGSTVTGWTRDGRVLYRTARFSGLPDDELVALDPNSGRREILPLSQAADGVFDESGRTLFFTRLSFQGSHTKRYQGGTAQNLWRYTRGEDEAVPLTADWPGTSKHPMLWQGRIWFVSDRDGTMNLWSMEPDGRGLRQETHHVGWDVQSPSLSQGRIVYQLGADLRRLDLATGKDAVIPIRLASDLDQMRVKWVAKPMDYVTSAHLSPTGDRVALTARGQVFVAPAGQGRFVQATRAAGVRYRDGRFLPDGKSLLALSDETGEVEIVRVPANGVGREKTLTHDGHVLRWEAIPSPDGKWIAHHDKNMDLWLLEAATGRNTRIASNPSPYGDIGDLAWSPDSRWLAYSAPAPNSFRRIRLYAVESGKSVPVTTDRYSSGSPAWSPDGKWLYFLSDRNLESVVHSPWGPREPEPFFDLQTGIYELGLTKGLRSPFQPADELAPAKAEKGEQGAGNEGKGPAAKPGGGGKRGAGRKAAPPRVRIDLDGILERTREVPVPPGNYDALSTDGKRLYFLSSDAAVKPKTALKTLAIARKPEPPATLVEDVKRYELSLDGRKLLVAKGDDLLVLDAGGKAPADLGKAKIDLTGWTFPLDPREEWRQMFTEAWRLERDYFYDRKMNGVDWKAMKEKYLPLVDRVTDRSELSDLLGQMVGELSALHIFVRGGDLRKGPEQIGTASLGARLARDEKAGGWWVEHIYRADPDLPGKLSPLARPGVDVGDGDVIESINGVATLSVRDPGVLLEDQAGKQVLLRIKTKGAGGRAARDVVVVPESSGEEKDLRYAEWEYTRRLEVEKKGGGEIGYVHLRAMGAPNIAEWSRGYFPVFDRQGLIIDVRHNRGGNVDSWILEKLLRRAWFYWRDRIGAPYWNMQYAFRGHMVVLCDSWTASDGEAFSEGFRRLGLGKILGSRTWGGEIWLSADNFLVDKGIATAAETGVYGPEGDWLIEGHGVNPDIVVDNGPHATFLGRDAQLDAAIALLQEEIRKSPTPVPPVPPYPDKSLKQKPPSPGSR